MLKKEPNWRLKKILQLKLVRLLYKGELRRLPPYETSLGRRGVGKWILISFTNHALSTAEDAVKKIQSGQRVFLTGNCSTPQTVLAALVKHAPNLKDVEICQALSVGPADYVSPEMEGHMRVNTMFISANIRKAVQEGRADFTPVLAL